MNETRQLGRYELLRELGRGAMGVVYVASDPHLQRTVAIKTIRIGDLANKVSLEYERRFLTEARSAARLSHPAIVSVYDAGRDGDVTYLVMEYVSGINLKYCLRHGVRFSVLGAVRILLDVLSALEHAHNQKVIHRDVKPENILIDALGCIKLTDFGIARIQDGPDNGTMVSGLSIGTPRYMSPEQVQGLEVDARSDLFSAGVMLYELLTAALPFDGAHPMAVVAKILHVAHAPVQGLRPEVPPALAVVLDKALSKNPDERYQTAQAFSAALVQACEGTLPLDRMTQVTGGSSAVALVEPESVPMLLWLLQGEPDTEPAQDPPGATTSASLAAYAATQVAASQGQVPQPKTDSATELMTQVMAAPASATEALSATSTSPQSEQPIQAAAVQSSDPTWGGQTQRQTHTTHTSADETWVHGASDTASLQLAWDATSTQTAVLQAVPASAAAAEAVAPAVARDESTSAYSNRSGGVVAAPVTAVANAPMPAGGVRRLWPVLVAVPVLGVAAWMMLGRQPSAPPVPKPTEAAAPQVPSEPKEEVLSTTSQAPLTPGAIVPPPLTPPPAPGTPVASGNKPATKPKVNAAPVPEPAPAPVEPPPPPPQPEPKPEVVKPPPPPPPPPAEPCKDKEGFFAREGCLWDACKLPAHRSLPVCARFQKSSAEDRQYGR